MTDYYNGIRTPRGMSKEYLASAFLEFASHWPEFARVEFCKQDDRGAPSISLIRKAGTVGPQKHFTNNAELIAYVQGFNKAKSGEQYL